MVLWYDDVAKMNLRLSMYDLLYLEYIEYTVIYDIYEYLGLMHRRIHDFMISPSLSLSYFLSASSPFLPSFLSLRDHLCQGFLMPSPNTSGRRFTSIWVFESTSKEVKELNTSGEIFGFGNLQTVFSTAAKWMAK